MYADDTTVLITGKTLLQAKQFCNAILERFYLYFTVNKLSINPSKTKYMIYKPDVRHRTCSKRLYDTTNTTIVMNDIELEEVKSTKFLGLILNNKLNWDLHKRYVYNKICKNLGIIKKM